MKKWFIVIMVSVVLVASVIWADENEKEKLQLEARALIAEANNAQAGAQLWQLRADLAQKAIKDFVTKLDSKGYMVDQQTGQIVEKPKPPEPPKTK